MTYRDDAKAQYAREDGDPATGYVTSSDAQQAIDLLADEIDAKADLSKVGNLLTDNQATGDSGWVSDGTVAAGTAGDGTFGITSVWTYCVATPRIPVTAGDVVTWMGDVAQVGGGAYAIVEFKDSLTGGSPVGSTHLGNTIAAGQSGQTSVTVIVPAGATHAEVGFYASGSVLSTVFSRLSFHRGTGGTWQMPGVPIPHTGRRVTHPNTDDVLVQHWDDGLGRWQTTHYDSGWRDVSGSLINGWAHGQVMLRRVNRTVAVKIAGVYGASALATNPLTIPDGFRTAFSVTGPGTFAVFRDGYQGSAWAVCSYYGTLIQYAFPLTDDTWTTNHRLAFTSEWLTDDATPTSLPGTLVSAAPYA